MKTSIRAATALAFAILCGTPAWPQPFRGEAGIQKLVGNTLQMPDRDELMYVRPDGHAKHRINANRTDLLWRVEDDRFCVGQSWEQDAEKRCFTVEVSGSKANLTGAEGSVEAEILPGNPKGM